MLKPAVSSTAPRPGRPQRASHRRLHRGPTGLPHPPIVIPRSYYRTSNAFGIAETTAIFAMLLVTLAGLPVAAQLGWPAMYVLLLPLLGAASQKTSLLLRETGRGTLFTNQHANRAVGAACGALLGASVRHVAREERDHLRHLGTELDTANLDLLRLRGAGPARLLAYLLLPLTGLPFLRAMIAHGGLLGDLVRRRPMDAPPEGHHHGTQWKRLALFVFVQAGVSVVATGFGRYWLLALAFPLSAATLGMCFGRVRTLSEHLALPGSRRPYTVRSHAANFMDQVFFSTLNMNFQVEHHLYPQIPASNLTHVHRDLARVGYFGDDMVSPSILRTVRRCLAAAGSAAR